MFVDCRDIATVWAPWAPNRGNISTVNEVVVGPVSAVSGPMAFGVGSPIMDPLLPGVGHIFKKFFVVCFGGEDTSRLCGWLITSLTAWFLGGDRASASKS